MKTISTLSSLILMPLVLASCSKDPGVTDEKPIKSTPITVTTTKSQDIDIKLESIGIIKTLTEPVISAEIEARVEAIHVDVGSRVNKGDLLLELDGSRIIRNRNALKAEVKNLNVQIHNAQKIVQRYKTLHQKNLAPISLLEEEETKLVVFKMRKERAQALLEMAKDNLQRARVKSPVDGIIDRRMVSVGDFLKLDEPLFKLSTSNALRAVAAFPETAVEQLQVGQKMFIRYPLSKLHLVESPITQIRPMINAGNKSIVVIADFANPGIFKPGASFIAEVVIEQHKNAVIVPNRSVVIRPAGEVVYVIKDNTAKQQIVTTGERLGNEIEIVAGLKKDSIIAFDGAGFLTDGALVDIKEKQ